MNTENELLKNFNPEEEYPSAVYAPKNDGPLADSIAWITFDNFSETSPFPNPYSDSVIEKIPGTEEFFISFNINIKDNKSQAFPRRPYGASNSAFGVTAYKGIKKQIIINAANNVEITLSDILVFNKKKEIIPYEIVTVDAESTRKITDKNSGRLDTETWEAYTNGGVWQRTGLLPGVNTPNGDIFKYKGIGTHDYKAEGGESYFMPSMVISTISPEKVIVKMHSDIGIQGAAFGVVVHPLTENLKSYKVCCFK